MRWDVVFGRAVLYIKCIILMEYLKIIHLNRRQLTNNGSNMTIGIPESMSLAHDFLLSLNERMIRSLSFNADVL